jgi:autotransporter-associated beta strand protein
LAKKFDKRGFVRCSARFLVDCFLAKPWLGVLSLILIGSSGLYGQENVWQGAATSISWFTASNWSLGAPPTINQTALVNNGTTAQIAQIPEGSAEAEANTLTVGSTVAGSTVQLVDAGRLTLTNPLIIGTGGTFRFSGGTLVAANGTPLHNNGTILFDTAVDHLLVHNVDGSGQLIMDITGTLSVLSNNTYSGRTMLIAGTLEADSATALSPNSAFTVNSTLNLNGFNNAIGSLSGTGTVLNNAEAAAATLTVGNDNSNSTFSGVVENGTSVLQLTKVGTGTLTLTGANTYTGGTNLNGGILAVNSDGNLGTGPLSFNGGTLEALAAGGGIISSKGITLNAGGGTFLADAGTNSILNGVISGVGSLTKDGLGMMTLTGANTYSGGTNLNGGILAVNSDGNLGTGPLSFNGGTLEALAGLTSNKAITLNAGGGTFLADSSTASTLSGAITGVGALTKTGSGTLILTGTNTYGGGTTLSAGTLQLGNGGTTGSITGNIIDNGILAFNRSNVLSFGGAISGTGSVQQNGTGTTVLTGNNTYTGGTTINAGTLQLGNGGTSGSIVGNVIDNGALIFNRSNTVTFGGVISGTGSVQQNGTGTTVLVMDNTYSGATTVNGGSLIVDGSIASAQTLVNSGGFLGGHGTIGGNVVNSGTVGQLNSPGTLTVTGNYTQNPGGTLQIQIAGLGTGQHDLLAVNGHATLAGDLQLVRRGGFNLSPGDQIVFLTANNGVSGNFSNLQNGFVATGTIVQAQVIALSNGVVLEAQQGSFATTPGVAITPNNFAVAKALDSAAGDPREAALFAFLDSEPLANLPHDLTLIAPTQISSMNATSMSLGNVQASNVGQRLANVRGGSTGFSAAGFTINGSTPSFSSGLSGPTGTEGKAGPSVLAPVPENRWGVFLTGLGEFTNVDSTFNAAGYNVDTGGFTLGVDYRVTPNFAIGLFGGYAHTSVDLVGGGDIDVNSGNFGLYATLFGNSFYLDTSVSAGPSGYDTRRTALQGTASGSTDGTDVNFLIAGGYDWKVGNLTIGPTASFQFSYVGLNSFTETGSLAPLKFPDQNTESERTAFGAKASYQWKLGHITVIPQVTAAWQHEYGSVAYAVVASFASGAGNSFTVNGPEIGRDSLLIGAGVSVLWSDRISTYVYYDGDVARTNYDSHSVSGGIRITF